VIKVFDTIQNLFCNPLRSLAARFGTERRRVFFFDDETDFFGPKDFFLFCGFFGGSLFSLSSRNETTS
jgi:hypothetical protein